MVASREVVADGLGRAICEQYRRVVAEHRIAERGLHAHAGRAPCYDELADSRGPQGLIQLRIVETTVAGLVDKRLARLWAQLIQHAGSPTVPNENACLAAVGSLNLATDVKMLNVHEPVRGVGRPHI